jgi:hypothetical protein
MKKAEISITSSEINHFAAHRNNPENLLLNPKSVEISDFTINQLLRVNIPKNFYLQTPKGGQ